MGEDQGERRYVSTGSKCGACGEDLGPQTIWTLVFADDPPELVDDVLSGRINHARCQRCEFDGGWMWPSIFLFVDHEQKRAVCATMVRRTEQLRGLLREGLDVEPIRARGLDPARLLARTLDVGDYRQIAEALQVPVEQVELRNCAIDAYLTRRELRGRERIEHLIATTIESGALSLEADELTPEMLTQVEAFRAGLTGDDDPRVEQVLDHLIDGLRGGLVERRRRLPQRDQMRALGEVLATSGDATLAGFLAATFQRNRDEAVSDVLQLRLSRLCDLHARGRLDHEQAPAIDYRPELRGLVDTLIATGGDSDQPILFASDRSALPAIRSYLASLAGRTPPVTLRDPRGGAEGPPPAWWEPASEVLTAIYAAQDHGAAPTVLLDRLADSPLGLAYVHAEIADWDMQARMPSGAMHHLSRALCLIDEAAEATDGALDPMALRMHAICMERVARVQARYGRFEDALAALHAARAQYEQIGAGDGVIETMRFEAGLSLELGRLPEAEKLFMACSETSRGASDALELQDLLNLANIYRRMRPGVEAVLSFTSRSTGAAEAVPAEARKAEPAASTPDPVVRMREGAPMPSFEDRAGIRLLLQINGAEPLCWDIADSELLRLLYRALAVALLNGDAGAERTVLGRLAAVYGEQDCADLAGALLERLLASCPLEDAGLDAMPVG